MNEDQFNAMFLLSRLGLSLDIVKSLSPEISSLDASKVIEYFLKENVVILETNLELYLCQIQKDKEATEEAANKRTIQKKSALSLIFFWKLRNRDLPSNEQELINWSIKEFPGLARDAGFCEEAIA